MTVCDYGTSLYLSLILRFPFLRAQRWEIGSTDALCRVVGSARVSTAGIKERERYQPPKSHCDGGRAVSMCHMSSRGSKHSHPAGSYEVKLPQLGGCAITPRSNTNAVMSGTLSELGVRGIGRRNSGVLRTL